MKFLSILLHPTHIAAVMIALQLISAVGYLVIYGAGGWRMAMYWLAAAVLTVAVTLEGARYV